MRARTDLWEARAGNRPGPPGPCRRRERGRHDPQPVQAGRGRGLPAVPAGVRRGGVAVAADVAGFGRRGVRLAGTAVGISVTIAMTPILFHNATARPGPPRNTPTATRTRKFIATPFCS